MKILEETLTIIHIRISGISFMGYKLRHAVTVLMMIMLIVNLIQLFYATVNEFIVSHLLESSVFLVLNIYFILYWLKSWPKAGAMLNKAGDYENNMNLNKKS